MPLYEYRCPACRSVFELLRPIGRAGDDATCPEGHPGGERVVSLVAARAWGGGSAEIEPSNGGGGCGGCAGGACACSAR
jgi:putative FmdB family regulatory protein